MARGGRQERCEGIQLEYTDRVQGYTEGLGEGGMEPRGSFSQYPGRPSLSIIRREGRVRWASLFSPLPAHGLHKEVPTHMLKCCLAKTGGRWVPQP